MALKWSAQAEDILKWFAEPDGSNLVVVARAGVGKTTVALEGINRAPEDKIVACAFNKRIAEEFNQRLDNPRAEARTLHSIGNGIVTRYWGRLRIGNGERADNLAEQVCGARVPDTIKRLVSKLHTKGREIAPHADKLGDLTDLMFRFECEPDEEWAVMGFDSEFVEAKALEAMDLAARVKPVATGIDFADMIFLPVRNHWLNKTTDLVVVDEAQDMTVAQLEIAQGICRGRIAVIGDNRQAIYGFRGADSESLARLKDKLNAKELKLTYTYRCGKNIVALANVLVPDFEAGPENHDGEVLTITNDRLVPMADHGDFILSRLNAPLVGTAMSLLRNGKRARVAGRDIGKGLIGLVRKLAKGPAATSIEAFLEKVDWWSTREVAKFTAANRPERIEAIKDQADMLIEMATGANTVAELINRIEALFTDDGLGRNGVITCSSVHRAKGLDADRVFVLKDTLRDWDQEELNIQYVAITRAKNQLVWVV